MTGAKTVRHAPRPIGREHTDEPQKGAMTQAGKEEDSRQYRRFVTRLNDSRDGEMKRALRDT